MFTIYGKLNSLKRTNEVAEMNNYTAQNFLNSSRFLEVATEDAVGLVAKANGQTYGLTLRALAQQVPNVVRDVTKLISVAAEHCARPGEAGPFFRENHMNQLSTFSKSGTVWTTHLDRKSITEKRTDGTQVTYSWPQGGKTKLPPLR
jgi:hypothetical protein